MVCSDMPSPRPGLLTCEDSVIVRDHDDSVYTGGLGLDHLVHNSLHISLARVKHVQLRHVTAKSRKGRHKVKGFTCVKRNQMLISPFESWRSFAVSPRARADRSLGGNVSVGLTQAGRTQMRPA